MPSRVLESEEISRFPVGDYVSYVLSQSLNPIEHIPHLRNLPKLARCIAYLDEPSTPFIVTGSSAGKAPAIAAFFSVVFKDKKLADKKESYQKLISRFDQYLEDMGYASAVTLSFTIKRLFWVYHKREGFHLEISSLEPISEADTQFSIFSEFLYLHLQKRKPLTKS